MNIVEEIIKLKEGKRAIILAHNYQPPEVQDIADYVGDSLELSIKAMLSDAETIVFAGVDFMVEQAYVLAPNKKVLHPEPDSKCPMAAMITVEDIRRARAKYPKSPVVVYVNSPALIKAEADYIVTSSSALKLVSNLEEDTVLFGPDRNLADYLALATGKRIIPIPPDSHCPVHEKIKVEHVIEAKRKFPEAKVVVHPECTRDVRSMADYIGSTSQMVRFVKESGSKSFIIGTEVGIIHRMLKENPGKSVVPAFDKAVCDDMKKINLEKILLSLRSETHRVKVDEKISVRVREVLERSFELIGVEAPWRRR